MRLDVGVLGSEKLLCPLDGEGFHDIDVFAAAVPAFPGVTLRVFVGEQGALGFHDRRRGEIFRGDEFDVVPLAVLLAHDGLVKFRIGNGDGTAGGFADAALVAAAFELGGDESIDHLDRGLGVDVFSGKAENVRVVVLAGGGGFLDVADIGGADVGVAVRGDAHAHSGSAGEDAEVKSGVRNVASHGVSEIRIIHGIRRVGAEILDLMSGLPEMGHDGVFHFIRAMIGADGDADWGIAHCYWDVPGLNAGQGRMETGNFGKVRPGKNPPSSGRFLTRPAPPQGLAGGLYLEVHTSGLETEVF